MIDIDQQPIGRTPRSNPATYTKAFDAIRDVFAQTPEARAYGYKPGRFSFNVKGGRCEACEGDGVRKVEMHFLADVYVTCEVCRGKRYNEATLRVQYKGKSIAEVLETSVVGGAGAVRAPPRSCAASCRRSSDVGLGYITLGQPATTLSGGEAQRIKLVARARASATPAGRFYILDEPTTGLHFEDVRKLLAVLPRLVEAGNTVLVIEHNLDVIKTADWVIDLGPEGGARRRRGHRRGHAGGGGARRGLVHRPVSRARCSASEERGRRPPPDRRGCRNQSRRRFAPPGVNVRDLAAAAAGAGAATAILGLVDLQGPAGQLASIELRDGVLRLACELISTKAKPRARPVSRSVMTFRSTTAPTWANRSRRSASVVS